ncbi:P-loop containing nucleoside triphosphate hydrolase protein [Laetiporus sulphureus 93-53]|uniref:DNA 3'-5' helicase n=1 Tax=Laetiporus sulphureus 93-53 TaxID=1314785 RepID=A0A165DAE6_9APHY|nr:P-loop containing nucleoside triphosphate hydrolase protein [Laetiporus sulphureus 93-53]KZT04434.1 P-loop containing nucleoside triphosphate hydrolase protein [Laetiporus sulphureus 93-53]
MYPQYFLQRRLPRVRARGIAINHLQDLNAEQRQAVFHPCDIPLQILAGPGTGKTRVLTARIADMILNRDLPPRSICAVTFTNKAAVELRERLYELVGDEASQIRTGTFHGLCTVFLRKYADFAGLSSHFTVCGAGDRQKVISDILKSKEDFQPLQRSVKVLESMLSKMKGRGHTAEDFLQYDFDITRYHFSDVRIAPSLGDIHRLIGEVFERYETSMKTNSSLDFDDLITQGVKLFSQAHPLSRWCRHLFVDEFQDTDAMQYTLIRHLAIENNGLTIAGDPDQSIYGWRSAEIENFNRMRRDFPHTERIALEVNYRSTGAILKASMAIIEQDCNRVSKTLRSNNERGATPLYRTFVDRNEEAKFLANEIRRIIGESRGKWHYGDVAILVRTASLTRYLETALLEHGIPYRLFAGTRFFDRSEIMDLLAYLQLVDNDHFRPAFNRVINRPTRSIGEKTLSAIYLNADRIKISPLKLVEQIHDDLVPDVKPSAKKKLTSFVETIRKLRKLANAGSPPSELLNILVESIEYQSYLKQTEENWEDRWQNVQELINFASEPQNIPLRRFLQETMLTTNADAQINDDVEQKVTIATCHMAKGLEWPIVMVPSVVNGSFPASFSSDVDEERRLLFVACTRAQEYLHLTNAETKTVPDVSMDVARPREHAARSKTQL